MTIGPALADGATYILYAASPDRYLRTRTSAAVTTGTPILLPRVTRVKKKTLLASGNSTLTAGHAWTITGGGSTDAGNSSANHTTDFALGDRSVKLVTAGAGSTGAWASLTRLTALDLTGKLVRVWFKIDSASAANLFRIGIYFGSGASAFLNQINQYILDYTTGNLVNGSYAKPGEWVSYTINPAGCASVTGTIDWTQIQDFRFRVEDRGAGSGTTVLFGGLELLDVDAAYPAGVISLTFDDAYVSQFTEARKKMDEKGYAGSLYLIQERLDTAGCLTSAHVLQLAELNDWEVALHASTNAIHNATDGYVTNSATPQLLRDDWDAQKRALQALGLTRGMNHVAYPQGKFDTATLSEVKRRFVSGRTTISRAVETLPVGDPFRLRAIQCGNTTTLTPNGTVGTLEWYVDMVAAYGGWLILCFHDIVTSATNTLEFSVANFGTLIDYIATKGVPVRTVGEVLGT